MTSRTFLLAAAAGLTLQILPWGAWALNAQQWSEHSIYQVLTDRFALTNGSSADCWIRGYCGGTYEGIQNKLDYIQGMGFDAIWISPIIHNIEGNTTYGYAFHGYWGDDPYTLNPHFGSPDDLKNLSDALHSRNMSLMVDVVINHLAANQTPNSVNYSAFPSPFNSAAAFHPDCTIDYANQTSIEDCWLVDQQPPLLADIKSENSTVFDAMVRSVVQNVQDYAIDGIRLDTAKHVPKRFLSQFQEEVGVLVTGEALNESIAFASQYQSPLASVLNYPLFFTVTDPFVGRTTFDLLAATVEAEQVILPNINAVTNFLDNHDQPRLASRVGSDVIREMNAVTFLFFIPGIPIVYYGFEQRFDGGGDPDNREGMWTSGYDTNATLYKHIAQLNMLRKAAINSGDFLDSAATILLASDTHLAFQRGPLVVVVTNTGSGPSISEPDAAANGTLSDVMISQSSFPPKTTLTDLLSCEKTVTDAQGSFNSSNSQGGPRVWASSQWKTTLCS
ncbi:hypothetical protein LTR10_024258 [Elasticomyces elasticus]|uniref:Alpha-amylase n=1 Tax=Exophiala sideris TaxID=1016849 RepID=A0ABR0JHK2_9EURO|nr:hypothetical protein LTR10_024258 [Elasticomyces elasticus]KAK5033535.1 hypothetical protein LTS07_003840 [Exophiala sideris]KAK5041970.1 hypothetical protein LTR13_001775 [Exophiala sideris]KAK5064079.1 hypothetical protein LTR69_003848 [Exophiala sideris]KAK5185238.1 hypothetical protein LTR44_002226 [Eurotiomycetes sp. CCFEE 6388]